MGTSQVIGTIQPGPFGDLNFSDVASWGVQLFFFLIGMVALVMFLQGALNWVTSGGDEKKLADARKRLTSAGIGLVIAVVLFVLWNVIVGPILGIFKNGQITVPTIQSMCKRPGQPATNISECCTGVALVAGPGGAQVCP